MTKGCFIVSTNPEDQLDIKFSLKPNVKEDDVPEDQKQLFLDIEETASIIRTLTKTNEDKKKKYIDKLTTLAQAGLVSDHPLVNIAQKALENLKDDIRIQEGGRIKNEYMKSLGICAIILIIIIIILISILDSFSIHFYDKYAYVFIGTMIGTWISFGARKIDLTFKELSIIENDGVTPLLRLLFIGICACIVLLFMSNDIIITLSIGNINTQDINNSIELQLIIGVLVGLIEYKIGTGLYNKANGIINIS